jgi:ribosome-associated protein
VRSVADAVEAALKARGEPPMGIEGYEEGRWVLIDCADTIVHIFQQEIRDHYDLERLWSDAPTLELAAASRSVGT